MPRSDLEKVDDSRRILALKRAGLSVAEIREATGLSAKSVKDVLADALREGGELAVEEKADLRAAENDRLDALLAGIWVDAAGGSVSAINAVLRIMERRAKLLGLDLEKGADDQTNQIVIAPQFGAAAKLAEGHSIEARGITLPNTGNK